MCEEKQKLSITFNIFVLIAIIYLGHSQVCFRSSTLYHIMILYVLFLLVLQ